MTTSVHFCQQSGCVSSCDKIDSIGVVRASSNTKITYKILVIQPCELKSDKIKEIGKLSQHFFFLSCWWIDLVLPWKRRKLPKKCLVLNVSSKEYMYLYYNEQFWFWVLFIPVPFSPDSFLGRGLYANTQSNTRRAVFRLWRAFYKMFYRTHNAEGKMMMQTEVAKLCVIGADVVEATARELEQMPIINLCGPANINLAQTGSEWARVRKEINNKVMNVGYKFMKPFRWTVGLDSNLYKIWLELEYRFSSHSIWNLHPKIVRWM